MSKLLLIDGNAIIHRAYHAMPKLTTPAGEPIGAVQGFLNILIKTVTDLNPTHIAVAWDRREPTFRKKMYKEYQSHRPETDEDLGVQFKTIRKILESMNIVQFDKKGYEADDLIGTMSTRAIENKVDKVIIATGDKDQMQLVNKKVKLLVPVRGLNAQIFGARAVKEKLGIAPEQVIDLKAFMGDSSDNYPGVYGIGPKTAISLLEKYHSYPNVYKHLKDLPENLARKLIAGKEGGDMSYKLARIVCDVDIDIDFSKMSEWILYDEKVEREFGKVGFRSVKKRAEKVQKEIKKEVEDVKQPSLF